MATEKKAAHREAIDTWLIIGAFIAGIVPTLALKILGFPPYYPAVAAGLVIIVYAVATYNFSAARLEPEQIGDNCYYLGFCITLASLAYTLYALGSAGSDAGMLGDVISGFGVALSSTVVGVMARVVLLQFRVDLAARDKEARSELNQVVRLFGAEMQKSVSSAREAITQILQTLEEHTASTLASNRKMQDSFEARIEKLVEDATDSMKEAMHEVVESGKDMNKRLSASSRSNMTTAEKTMTSAMEAITDTLRQSTSRLEAEMTRAHESSVKSLEKIIMEVSAAMKLTSEEASKAINLAQQKQHAEMTKAVEAVAMNVFEIAHQFGSQKDKIAASLDEFTAETRAVREEVSGMVNESVAARDAVKRSADIATSASQKMSWAAEKIETSLKGSQSAGPAVPVSLPHGTDTQSQQPYSTPPTSPAAATSFAQGPGQNAGQPQQLETQPGTPIQPPRQKPQPTTAGAEPAPAQPTRPAHEPAPASPQRPESADTPPSPEPRRTRLGSFFSRANR